MRDEEYEWEDCTKEMIGASRVDLNHLFCGKPWYRFSEYLSHRIRMDGSSLFRIERRVAKPPAWEPKVGDWVEYVDSAYSGRGKVLCIAKSYCMPYLVADPNRKASDWHNAELLTGEERESFHVYTRLFPNTCRWFCAGSLKPLEK